MLPLQEKKVKKKRYLRQSLKKKKYLRQDSINIPQGTGWEINPVFWIWGGISLTLGSIFPLGSRHFDHLKNYP